MIEKRGRGTLFGNFETLVRLTRNDQPPNRSRNWQKRRRTGLMSLAKGILRAPQGNLEPILVSFHELGLSDPSTQGAVRELFWSTAVDIVTRKGDTGMELAGRILAERASKKS